MRFQNYFVKEVYVDEEGFAFLLKLYPEETNTNETRQRNVLHCSQGSFIIYFLCIFYFFFLSDYDARNVILQGREKQNNRTLDSLIRLFNKEHVDTILLDSIREEPKRKINKRNNKKEKRYDLLLINLSNLFIQFLRPFIHSFTYIITNDSS